MNYGTRILKNGDSGEDVEELQIRLAGFSGSVWTGTYGDGTTNQVRQFQKDYMKIVPTGIVDKDTFLAIDKFADQFPLNFNKLKCECGKCGGFGKGINKGIYIEAKPQIEAFHLYEYPGMHRALLWATRAVFFYFPDYKFIESCGYRCSIRNEQKGRTTTNHMGKAIDIDTILPKDCDKKDDIERCTKIRRETVGLANAQIGWPSTNKKSFEPDNIAPTWVHYDVRQYDSKYLADKFFCKNLEELNKRTKIDIGVTVKVGVNSYAPGINTIPPVVPQIGLNNSPIHSRVISVETRPSNGLADFIKAILGLLRNRYLWPIKIK